MTATSSGSTALSRLSSAELTSRLALLLGDERRCLVEFLVHLAELDRRRTYLELGYPSFFAYCTDALKLPNGSAWRRTTAARLLARFPTIADYLADGRLCLSTLVILKDVLQPENHLELLDRAAGCTEDEVRVQVATLRPRPDVKDSIRRLPAPSNAPTQAPSLFSTAASVPAATVTPPAPPVPVLPPPRPPKLEPLTAERRALHMTVGKEFLAELAQVKAALSHVVPDGNLEAIFRVCFQKTLEVCARRKRAALAPVRSRPTATSGPAAAATGADPAATSGSPTRVPRSEVTATSSPAAAAAGTELAATSGSPTRVPRSEVTATSSPAAAAAGTELAATSGAPTRAPRSELSATSGPEVTGADTEPAVTSAAPTRARDDAPATSGPEGAAARIEAPVTARTSAPASRADAVATAGPELPGPVPDTDAVTSGPEVTDASAGSLAPPLAEPTIASGVRVGPRSPHGSPKAGRYLPADVRRRVWERDQGRCAFVGANGKRCNSTHQLEFHHLEPFARGGAATVENVALRCKAHNLYQARCDFGDAHMARFSRATSVPASDPARPAAHRPGS